VKVESDFWKWFKMQICELMWVYICNGNCKMVKDGEEMIINCLSMLGKNFLAWNYQSEKSVDCVCFTSSK